MNKTTKRHVYHPTPLAPSAHDQVNAHPQDQHSSADQQRDRRLADELAENAGDNPVTRHRHGTTAIESDADGVPEDEDDLAETAARAAEAETDEPETRE